MDSTSAAAPARPAGIARLAIAFALLTTLATGISAGITVQIIFSMFLLPRPTTPWVSLSMRHELWQSAQSGILYGGLLGAAQWIAMRRWMRRVTRVEDTGSCVQGHQDDRAAGWWIVVTLAGALAGALLERGLVFACNPTTASVSTPVSIMLLAFNGAVLGAAQWGLLRRRAARAGWWIVLSALGMAATPLMPKGWLQNSQALFDVLLCGIIQDVVCGLPLGLLLGLGLTLLKPLTAEPAITKGRSRGWPEDRGARLLVAVGLVTFALGLFATYSFELDSPSGIQALLAYADLAPPYSLFPVLGLLLIPLSARVAAASHGWAAVAAGIGTGFALLPFLDFLSYPTMLRIPRAPICWLTAGLLLTVGWIVAGRSRAAGTGASTNPPLKGPPTQDSP